MITDHQLDAALDAYRTHYIDPDPAVQRAAQQPVDPVKEVKTAFDEMLRRMRSDPDLTGRLRVAIAALHAYDPSRNKIPNLPLPEIDTTIRPPEQYYPERQP